MSKAQDIYAKLPRTLQNLAVSAQGANFRWRRTSDRVIRGHLDHLLSNEHLPVEERRRAQERSLAEYLRAARHTSIYNRTWSEKLGINDNLRDDEALEALRAFPILEKGTVRGNEDQFWNRTPGTPVTAGFTSGTTGSPTKLLETQVSFSKRMAHVARLRSWAGVDPLHPRRASFTGRSISEGRPPHVRRNLADRSLLLSSVHLSDEEVEGYGRALESFNPVLLDGYPSAMLILSRLAPDIGESLGNLKAIICTAETLTARMKAELESSYGVTVFNQYAMSESACFWSTCEEGSMHMHDEYGFAEILQEDGQEAAPGQPGVVVTTSFYNSAMPLIRYRTGDLAVVSDGRACACGRTLPVVGQVVGRTDDILFVPGRGYVGRLDPVFKGISGIVEAQIRQVTLFSVDVRVVVDRRWTNDGERKLEANLHAKLGNSVQVMIQQCSQIPRGPNGKFRAVISECRAQYPSDMGVYESIDTDQS